MAFPPTWDEMERKDERIRELEAGLRRTYVLLNEGDDPLLHRICEAMEILNEALEGVPAAAPSPEFVRGYLEGYADADNGLPERFDESTQPAEEMEAVRDLHHPDPFAHVPKPES